MRLGTVLSLGTALAACAPALETYDGPPHEYTAPTVEEPIDSRHGRLVVLDSHLDIPARFHSKDYTFGLRGSLEEDGSQVDLPRMIEGALDVGMGADWESGGGVDGLSDITDLFRVTDALFEAGYTQEDIAKFWGGNRMRQMRDVEAAKTAGIASPRVVN